MSQDDDSWDDGEFNASWPFWFVAETESPDDFEKVAATLATVPVDNGRCPVAFTDYAAAVQFIEDENEQARLEPLAYAELTDFAAFLETLRSRGVEGLAFDPYKGRFRWITIGNLFEGIRNRPE